MIFLHITVPIRSDGFFKWDDDDSHQIKGQKILKTLSEI